MKDWGDSKDLDKDAKERSKERKKTVEENKGRTDKKAQAMNALKARREEKRERGFYFGVSHNFLCDEAYLSPS